MGDHCGVCLWSCKTLNVGRLIAVGRWKSVGAIGTIGSGHATFFGICVLLGTSQRNEKTFELIEVNVGVLSTINHPMAERHARLCRMWLRVAVGRGNLRSIARYPSGSFFRNGCATASGEVLFRLS
jgi:hypothetical protein